MAIWSPRSNSRNGSSQDDFTNPLFAAHCNPRSVSYVWLIELCFLTIAVLTWHSLHNGREFIQHSAGKEALFSLSIRTRNWSLSLAAGKMGGRIGQTRDLNWLTKLWLCLCRANVKYCWIAVDVALTAWDGRSSHCTVFIQFLVKKGWA